MKVKYLLKMLKDDGWFLDRTRGSHRQFRHPIKTGIVTVPGNRNTKQYFQAGKI